MCVLICVCRGQRSTLGFVLHWVSACFLFLRLGLSLLLSMEVEQGADGWPVRPRDLSACFCLSRPRITSMPTLLPKFQVLRMELMLLQQVLSQMSYLLGSVSILSVSLPNPGWETKVATNQQQFSYFSLPQCWDYRYASHFKHNSMSSDFLHCFSDI